VQSGNYLGIYLAKDHATVVCVAVEGRQRTLIGCFSVSAEATEKQTVHEVLAQRISAVCAERQIKFADAAVAMDCAMFMQHNIHSEFSETKKIAQTIHFDTEEALGTDATDVAIAFRIDSADKSGSNITTFTAQKHLLTDLLGSLQKSGIDPVSVEPDVNCLARFVCHNITVPPDARPLFALLSRRNGYFIAPIASPWQGITPMPAASMRTFLLNQSQNKNELLARQVSMTTALLQISGTVNRLEIFDAAGGLNFSDIAKKFTFQTEEIDVCASAKISAENLADCPDAVEFAIAYGAAIVHFDSPGSSNFRSDFMPYQGKRMRLERTLKFFAVAAAILMFAAGLYGFMQGMKINGYKAQLRDKFSKEFSAAMMGEKMPAKTKDAVGKISRALRRVKEAQKGFSLTGDEAIAAKMTLVLQAFNNCASATGLNIDTVSITDKTITINGDTPSPEYALRVFEALKNSGLNVLQQRLNNTGSRCEFGVTVEPRQQAGGGT